MSKTVEELRRLEARLPNSTFQREKSGLLSANNTFPQLSGFKFEEWIGKFNGSTSVLEIGGGRRQQTAVELLSKYPHVKYISCDPRKPDTDVETKLKEYPNYKFKPIGISDIPEELKGEKYNVVFGQNLGQHIPDPFLPVQVAYNLLNPDGIFFYNWFYIDKIEWDKIAKACEQKGLVFEHDFHIPENALMVKGIVALSLAVQKSSPDFKFPVKTTDQHITDRYGRSFTNHEVVFDPNSTEN